MIQDSIDSRSTFVFLFQRSCCPTHIHRCERRQVRNIAYDRHERQRGKQGNLANRKLLLLILSHVLAFSIGFLAFVTTTLSPGTDLFAKVVRSNPPAAPREYGDGWHSLEIFYGKSDRFETQIPQQEWYAYANQDVIISRLFDGKTHGYFIDLAANSAAEISNTYSLERKFNWTGLCIEPNHIYRRGLSFRDCQVVGAVVGGTRMEEITFQESTGAEPKYTVTLDEVLERFQAPVEMDYLSLYVEGTEYIIMKHFPFHDYSFKAMTVERPNEHLKALFAEHGYELVGTIRGITGETLWVQSAIKDSLNIASIKEFLQ